ncbi:MAG TPA: UDP-N-acetylmuramoyl-tripeptide--D-alanyl-D-alanine ligase [Fimbriimonadaceae bacterium]|nr:UDP-N-acetylmuramoyl-tripeptide--D-alanyl-D-alanine ligase [Fimbriimonadaceae bacterium]
MKPTPVAELAKLLGGTPAGIADSLEATGWATDSRDVKPGDVFLAIKGARSDGHEHVPGALTAGAVAAVAEQPVEGPHILVRNLPTALAKMASAYRDRFDGPVIGITGSAGKTTTKEFIAAAVEPLGLVLKTEGNRNTEYTAPLMWTELTQEHMVVVCEMGMRGFGHIEHLASFNRPTIGVVTNIGFSHMELVGNREGIAKAKSEMLQALPEDGASVLWAEDDFLDALSAASPARVRTFGTGSGAECRITGYAPHGWAGCGVTGTLDGAEWIAEVPAIGRHIALDAAAAILAANCVGIGPAHAAALLRNAKLPPLRMEVREWNGATLLVDAYNASPASMLPAIEVLGEGDVSGRRIAVIGEMKELGEASMTGHRDVARALLQARVDWIMLFGAGTEDTQDELLKGGQIPYTIEQAENLYDVEIFLRRKLKPGDVALIKGSRSLELEKAVPK